MRFPVAMHKRTPGQKKRSGTIFGDIGCEMHLKEHKTMIGPTQAHPVFWGPKFGPPILILSGMEAALFCWIPCLGKLLMSVTT